ncbi:MAG: NifU family protein [Myxococcales bacterium]
MSAPDEAGFADRLRRIESLVAALETTGDPAAQANARELLQAVLELHAQGISRMLEIGGAQLVDACARDELVGSVLLLHDLHPLDLEERVRAAVEKVRPVLVQEGCKVELLAVQEGAVRVFLERQTHGHHTTAPALRARLEEAIWELAPDAESIEIEGSIEAAAPVRLPLVQLGVREAPRGGGAP